MLSLSLRTRRVVFPACALIFAAVHVYAQSVAFTVNVGREDDNLPSQVECRGYAEVIIRDCGPACQIVICRGCGDLQCTGQVALHFPSPPELTSEHAFEFLRDKAAEITDVVFSNMLIQAANSIDQGTLQGQSPDGKIRVVTWDVRPAATIQLHGGIF